MSKTNPKIGVVGIPDGWSTLELVRAVEEKTGHGVLIDMADVVCDLDAGKVLCHGRDLTALDAVIVKKIAKDYSPDAIDRIEMLRLLRGAGVKVFSNPDSMLPLLDRLSGTVRLRLGGIPMPATVITENVDEAVSAIERMGPTIAKPLFTSKARGMTRLEPGEGLRAAVEQFRAAGNPVMYLQQMVDIPGRDLGVTFLGGEYLATYARVQGGGSWSTSTASGGKYQPAEPSDEIIALAREAQGLFDLTFTCVDVVETANGPQVFEVSAFGGFRGLKEACGLDAAARYADFVIGALAHG